MVAEAWFVVIFRIALLLACVVVSRVDFCTIPEVEDNGEIPVYKRYDAKYESQMLAYMHILEEPCDVIDCPQAKKMAADLVRISVQRAALYDDDGYRVLARRAAVIAFRKACILYKMNGMKWSREMEDFCRWSFDYDMWVKMSLFSEPLAEEREVEHKVRRGGIANNLELLSDVFTRQDAYDLRVRLGKKNPNPKDMLGQWTARGFITYDKATGKYLKTQKYLSSHVA